MEELDHLARRRRRADGDEHGLVESDQGAHERKHLRVCLLHRRFELRRDWLTRLAQPHPLQRRGDGVLHHPALLGRLACDLRLETRFQLLPDARHGKEEGRLHLRQIGRDVARVGTGGDRAAQAERDVVVQRPLRDVGGRQPRDDAPFSRNVDQRGERIHDVEKIAMRELHALRRPGRSRRIDQRE